MRIHEIQNNKCKNLLLFFQNQIKQAEEWFKKAKQLDPEDTMVDHHYGKITL